ncbi:Leucine Rich Repeat [Seminavis robusta]|uniref:Leucine Rich Repeat n=1 Tax=Seminavis robusta TaxID=568900 RepID=A0A9N8HQA2_9STRA|nr:Leucine Rich Repeat [Seminavis robusta]|eukprot:Sro1147_g246380.1 Leucine Rich Repeat (1076) ;mRNA; r:18064-21579
MASKEDGSMAEDVNGKLDPSWDLAADMMESDGGDGAEEVAMNGPTLSAETESNGVAAKKHGAVPIHPDTYTSTPQNLLEANKKLVAYPASRPMAKKKGSSGHDERQPNQRRTPVDAVDTQAAPRGQSIPLVARGRTKLGKLKTSRTKAPSENVASARREPAIPLEPQDDLERNPNATSPTATATTTNPMPVPSNNNLLVVANPVADLPRAEHYDVTRENQRKEERNRQRKWQTIVKVQAAIFILIVVILAVVCFLVFGRNNSNTTSTSAPTLSPTTIPSLPQIPTAAPSFASFESYVTSLFPNYTRSAILQDARSPQAKAFEWLLADPALQSYSEWRIRQRFALATFYHATGGPDHWVYDANWLNYNVSECQWASRPTLFGFENYVYNITHASPCGEDGQYYQHMWQWGNGLQGSLPPELFWGLTTLRSISLDAKLDPPEPGSGSNDERPIAGVIPSTIGLVSDLEIFSIQRQQVSGRFPSEIGLLPSLKVMRLANNALTGELFTELGTMSSLTSLQLIRNRLSGSIPHQVGRLTAMETFQLFGNQLTGSIPTTIAGMTALKAMNLDWNQLDSGLPTEIGLLSSLTELTLLNNQLTGSIHASWGALSSLELLLLNGNSLSGTVPQEMCSLSALAAFQIDCRTVTCLPGCSACSRDCLAPTAVPVAIDMTGKPTFEIGTNTPTAVATQEPTAPVPISASTPGLGVPMIPPPETAAPSTTGGLGIPVGGAPAPSPAPAGGGREDVTPAPSSTSDPGGIGIGIGDIVTLPIPISEAPTSEELDTARPTGPTSLGIPISAPRPTPAPTPREVPGSLGIPISAPGQTPAPTPRETLGFVPAPAPDRPDVPTVATNAPSFPGGDEQVTRAPTRLPTTMEPTTEPLLFDIPEPTTEPLLFDIPDYSMEALIDPQSPQSMAYSWWGDTLDPNRCDADGRIVALSIEFISEFVGTHLPPEIGLLSRLEELSLYELENLVAELSDMLPTPVLSLPLTTLFLHSNLLFGSIPSDISGLTSLSNMNLHGQQLSGTIPSEMGQLENLQFLALYDNPSITGVLPPTLGALASLESILIHRTLITGTAEF